MTLIDNLVTLQMKLNKKIMADKFKEEQHGYCMTCKKSMDRIALCDQCAGRRDGGKHHGKMHEDPPEVEQKPWSEYDKD